MAAPSSGRSPRDRCLRRARWTAAGLQSLAHVMMLAAVWGTPVRAVQVATRAPGPFWSDPWRLWALAEWTVACLAASYLLWSASDVVRDGLVGPDR